jgi:hypothetical protein
MLWNIDFGPNRRRHHTHAAESLHFSVHPRCSNSSKQQTLLLWKKWCYIYEYKCYSLAQAPGATWTLVIFTPPLTTIPISFYWFTYNSQIFIATDNQIAVLNFAAGTSQSFWDSPTNLPKMPSTMATGIPKIFYSNKRLF